MQKLEQFMANWDSWSVFKVALKIDIQLVRRGRERVEKGMAGFYMPFITSAYFLLTRTQSHGHI